MSLLLSQYERIWPDLWPKIVIDRCVHKLFNHEIMSPGPIYLDRYLIYDHTFSHYAWTWIDLRLKVLIGHCDLIVWFSKGIKIYEHDALGYKSSWSYRLTKTEAVEHAVIRHSIFFLFIYLFSYFFFNNCICIIVLSWVPEINSCVYFQK